MPGSKVVARGRSRNRQPAIRQKTKQKNEWSIITFDDIAAWQAKNGLSNNAFCRIADISTAAYYSWKNGVYAPSTNLQRKIQGIIQRDDPTDPKSSAPRHSRPMAISKQELEDRIRDIKAERPRSKQELPPRDADVAEVIAAIEATAAIICSRLESGAGLKNDQLIQLTGSIQQALLGDF